MLYLWPCYLTHHCLQTTNSFYGERNLTMSSCARDSLVFPWTPHPGGVWGDSVMAYWRSAYVLQFQCMYIVQLYIVHCTMYVCMYSPMHASSFSSARMCKFRNPGKDRPLSLIYLRTHSLNFSACFCSLGPGDVEVLVARGVVGILGLMIKCC